MPQTFARVPVVPGPVAEVISLPDGAKPDALFAEAIAATLYVCGGTVKERWVYSGSTFAAPTEAPLTAAQLVAYANTKHAALRDGGITVNIGTASTPDEVNVASDVNGRSLVSGCVQLVGLATSNNQPAPTFPWINNGGTQLTLTAVQMMTIGLQLGTFVQATYAALGAVLAAIAAGTITTTAQIDTPPAGITAWPSTSY